MGFNLGEPEEDGFGMTPVQLMVPMSTPKDNDDASASAKTQTRPKAVAWDDLEQEKRDSTG